MYFCLVKFIIFLFLHLSFVINKESCIDCFKAFSLCVMNLTHCFLGAVCGPKEGHLDCIISPVQQIPPPPKKKFVFGGHCLTRNNYRNIAELNIN